MLGGANLKPISNIQPISSGRFNMVKNQGYFSRNTVILQQAKALTKDSVEIRFNKLEKVKDLISIGNYAVSADKVAGKIINDISLYYNLSRQ